MEDLNNECVMMREISFNSEQFDSSTYNGSDPSPSKPFPKFSSKHFFLGIVLEMQPRYKSLSVV